MEDNKFWLSIWTVIGVVVAVFIMTVGGCTAYESRLIAQMTAGGTDPIDARCAVSGINSKGECLIRSASRAPK